MKTPITTFGCFLLLVFLIAACAKVEDVQSLEEFDVPFEPGVVQRIYTYIRRPGGDTIVNIYAFSDSERNRYWRTSRVNSETTLESIYEVNNNRKKLIAEYQYQPLNNYAKQEKIKGEVLQYEEFDIGHRFTGLKTTIRYTNSDGFSNLLIENNHAIRETTEVWQNTEYKALELDYTQVYKEQIKYVPFFGHTYAYEGKAVFLEGIGLFKWTVKSDYGESETKLLSIKILKQ